MNFQMLKLVLEKAEELEIKFPISSGSLKKKESSRKTSTSALLNIPNPLTVSLVSQMVKHLPAVEETWVQSLGQEDPLEKEMATHSNILAWRISWTEEPGRLQSMGLQRVRYD